VRVTHRFHPLFGREFRFVDRHRTWEEDRVALLGDDGQVFSLPAGWTDVDPVDAFVAQAAGRCPFTLASLRALAETVGMIRGARPRG
jgi:uncharacterized protein DUF5372